MSDLKSDIGEVVKKWTNLQEVLLRTGEMEPQEQRTAMAVLHGFAFELESVLEKHNGSA